MDGYAFLVIGSGIAWVLASQSEKRLGIDRDFFFTLQFVGLGVAAWVMHNKALLNFSIHM